MLVAAIGLADPIALGELRTERTQEWALALIAIGGVLVYGTLGGIVVAVILSLIVLLWNLNHPAIVQLGRDPVTSGHGDLALEPGLETVPGLLILRVEGRLFFANARSVTKRLLDLVDATPADTVGAACRRLEFERCRRHRRRSRRGVPRRARALRHPAMDRQPRGSAGA